MSSLPQRLASPILALPRAAKRLVALLLDAGLCVLAVWLAYFLRLGEFVSLSHGTPWAQGVALAAAVSIALALPVFIVSGLYRAIFRYSGWPALLAVARAVAVYAVLYGAIFMVGGIAGVPRTVGIIQPILLLLLVGVSRLMVRLWLGDEYRSLLRRASRPRVLIYGAGTTGRQLAQAMIHSTEMQVVGFLDDDARLHGQVLNGQPIYRPDDLPELVQTLGIADVLLAMPRLSRHRRNEILAQIRLAQVAVRTLPSLVDLAQGKISVSDLRELDIDDLLGREPVMPNHILLAKNIAGKVVLVTGAGGSIGSELCRQILAVNPAKLLLIGRFLFMLILLLLILQVICG